MRKSLFTYITLEWLLSRVDIRVARQLGGGVEHLVARLALVALRVRLQVLQTLHLLVREAQQVRVAFQRGGNCVGQIRKDTIAEGQLIC